MRLPQRGEKGFTLIELLIVVAILGVLAAVVIPNVGRFIGRGESEAKNTELSNIQSSVVAMMVDRNVSDLEAESGVTLGTSSSNMSGFPDTSGQAGAFILYGANVSGTTVNYVATSTTAYYYTVDGLGSVVQHTAAGHPHSDGGE